MDYKNAASYWDVKDKDAKKMDREALLSYMDEFLKNHNTLALATGNGDYIDCTPLEYNYLERTIYIFTEGGHKFIGLENHKNVAVSVFESYTGFQNIHSLQAQMEAKVIEPFSEEYLKLLAYKRIPEAAMRKMAQPMHLLRLDFKSVDILSTDFKKSGFTNRQHIDF